MKSVVSHLIFREEGHGVIESALFARRRCAGINVRLSNYSGAILHSESKLVKRGERANKLSALSHCIGEEGRGGGKRAKKDAPK